MAKDKKRVHSIATCYTRLPLITPAHEWTNRTQSNITDGFPFLFIQSNFPNTRLLSFSNIDKKERANGGKRSLCHFGAKIGFLFCVNRQKRVQSTRCQFSICFTFCIRRFWLQRFPFNAKSVCTVHTRDQKNLANILTQFDFSSAKSMKLSWRRKRCHMNLVFLWFLSFFNFFQLFVIFLPSLCTHHYK